MAQRPNNTDLPPKETTQPLKGKGPHQQNDPGDWESQEREPWANAMECVQGQAQMYCYPRVVFEVFEPHVYTPLPAQPPSPAQQGDETGEVQQTQRTSGNLRSDTKGVAGQYNKHSLNDLARKHTLTQHLAPNEQGNGGTRDYPWAKGKPFPPMETKGAMKLSHKLAILPYINAPDLPDTSGEGDSTPSGSAEAGEDGNPSHSGETERGAGVKTTSSSEDERGRTPRRRRRRRGADSPDGGDEALRRAICENTHISKLKTCEKALEEPLPLLAEAEECARTARSLVV
ncbi:uncharacterized protein ATNIH1004_001854 [Aspergillus tanneri]|uniref:Uncharacterized protein n=1 Tax=Aspergillus tanneri TaxID=1220188 RepID=A0A5M9MA21_9EURO|nr:uncharacterized protein ATNIH1004_001854 [Aspergillus tanneri]KAA8641389.1 hypothetical protein ATNIH1004_001854 [Aspergillus tanneri]